MGTLLLVLVHLPECEEKPESFKYFKEQCIDSVTKKPVTGAKVYINEEYIGVTDKEGCSRTKCVPVGQVNTSTFKTGYYPTFQIFMVEEKMTGEVSLSPISETESLVRVHVSDENKNPIENAHVKMGMYEGYSRKDGVCYLKGVSRKKFDLTVTKDGYTSATATVDVKKQEEDVYVTLFDKSPVDATVKVTDTNKNPISNAKVTLNDKEVITNDKGEAVFTGFNKGEYPLKITHTDYAGIETRVNLINKSNIFTFALKPLERGTIDVIVKDNDSKKALENANVFVNNEKYVTNKDGKITTNKVAYGEHDIIVEHAGYNQQVVQVIVEKESTQKTVNLTIPKTSTVTFKTKGKDKTPISADIHIENDYYSLYTSTPESGEYIIKEIPFGKYNILCTSPGYDDYKGTVEFKSATETTETNLTPSQRSSVTLTILDFMSQKPVVGAKVKLENNEALTDDKGVVVFKDVAYSTYNTKITHNDYVTSYDETVVDNKTISKSISILKTSDSCKPTISISDTKTGTEVEDVKVTIKELNKYGYTNGFGQCTFYNIPRQEYTVILERFDYNKVEEKTKMTDGIIKKTLTPTKSMTNIKINVKDKNTKELIDDVKVVLSPVDGTGEITGYATYGKFEFDNIGAERKYNVTLSHKYYTTETKTIEIGKTEFSTDMELTPSVVKIGVGVYNIINSKPVKNARVYLDNDYHSTDDKGHCNIKTHTGNQIFRVQHSDYYDYSGDIVVSKDEEIKYYLNPVTDTSLNVIVENKEQQETRLDGADVTIQGITKKSVSPGIARFESLKTEPSTLTVKKEGFNDYSQKIDLSYGAMNTYAMLVPNWKETDVTVKVTNGVTPVSGANVELGSIKGTTGDDGKCVLAKVARGKYELKVTKDTRIATESYTVGDVKPVINIIL